MEEAGTWKDWKDEACVELTVLLGKRLNCEVRERALSVHGDDCGSWLRVCVGGWKR